MILPAVSTSFPLPVVDLLAVLAAVAGLAVIGGLAGVGVAVLVAASPLPTWIPHKPFVCRTCLSGWGSIGATGALLVLAGCPPTVANGFGWLVAALGGTGVAHYLLGRADRAAAGADPPLPTFLASREGSEESPDPRV